MSKLHNNVLKCSNKHCNNVITLDEIDKFHKKYLDDIKKCENTNNEFECITKLSKKSKWSKGVKKRTKCVKKKCGKKQKKLLTLIQSKTAQKKFIKLIVNKNKKLKKSKNLNKKN